MSPSALSHLEAETPAETESAVAPKAVGQQKPQEEDRSKPPARAPRTLSSFFSERLFPSPWTVQAGGGWVCLQRAQQVCLSVCPSDSLTVLSD